MAMSMTPIVLSFGSLDQLLAGRPLRHQILKYVHGELISGAVQRANDDCPILQMAFDLV